MNLLDTLAPLRAHPGIRRTPGLDDATLARFAGNADLAEAIEAAAAEYTRIKGHFADLLDQDEDAQVHAVQAGYINFYPDDAVNPYIALAARGPWIVTLKGAVLHDSGGYGMLGFGH
ncbi:MAG: lysine 6-aminotransferase, partial [Pseudomonadota bacterium]|nr:lysine 6-aminotransferase [Pseudomonadota bacterium]